METTEAVKPKRTRRTPEERIADMEAKLEAAKAKERVKLERLLESLQGKRARVVERLISVSKTIVKAEERRDELNDSLGFIDDEIEEVKALLNPEG